MRKGARTEEVRVLTAQHKQYSHSIARTNILELLEVFTAVIKLFPMWHRGRGTFEWVSPCTPASSLSLVFCQQVPTVNVLRKAAMLFEQAVEAYRVLSPPVASLRFVCRLVNLLGS
jgi:hypothetical protein